MIKAIIFDLDGTLLNTLDDLANSVNATLVHYGCPTHPKDAYRMMIGNGAGNLIKSSLPEGMFEKIETEAMEFYRNHYYAHYLDNTKPYMGIPEMLDKLAGLGIAMSVCSNKQHEATQAMIKMLFPHTQFSCVYGERAGVPRKPDPASVLEIAALMRTEPEHIMYVGDSGGDMQTAVNAEMLPVGVLWGFRGRDELIQHGAKILLSRPEEIFEYELF